MINIILLSCNQYGAQTAVCAGNSPSLHVASLLLVRERYTAKAASSTAAKSLVCPSSRGSATDPPRMWSTRRMRSRTNIIPDPFSHKKKYNPKFPIPSLPTSISRAGWDCWRIEGEGRSNRKYQTSSSEGKHQNPPMHSLADSAVKLPRPLRCQR